MHDPVCKLYRVHNIRLLWEQWLILKLSRTPVFCYV